MSGPGSSTAHHFAHHYCVASDQYSITLAEQWSISSLLFITRKHALRMDERSSAMEVERKENQIFVRNLAYETTSEVLYRMNIGPLSLS